MSDSEDDTFQSADEGDGEGVNSTAPPLGGKDKATAEQEPKVSNVRAKNKGEKKAVETKSKRKERQKKGKSASDSGTKEQGSGSGTGIKTTELKEKEGGDSSGVTLSGAKDGESVIPAGSVEPDSAEAAVPRGREEMSPASSAEPGSLNPSMPGGKGENKEAEEGSTGPGEENPTAEEKSTTEGSSVEPEGSDISGESKSGTGDVKASDIRQSLADKDNTPSPLEKVAEDGASTQSSGWGSWGSWGKSLGSSLLSTASSSVTTFSHQVGEGLHTVMGAVDSSLGAVPPEEMVKIQVKQSELVETDVVLDKDGHEVQEAAEAHKPPADEAETEEDDYNVSSTGGWLSSWGMNTLSQAVKSTVDTSKHLVEGSLDVLEHIGKKTVNVLKETDPGFMKTKSLLHGEKKPSLSELLQAAKADAEEKAKEQQDLEKAQAASFSLLFDEFQGLALLEALEMLSGQSESKVTSLLDSLPSDVANEGQELMDDMENRFNVDDVDDVEDETEHDFVKLVTNHLTEVHLGTAPDKLNQAHLQTREWLSKCFLEQAAGDSVDPQDIHERALRSLAEITAKCVEQFHKAGELILLQKDNDKNHLSRAENLASLTRVVCTEVQILSNKFTACLTAAAEDSDEVNPLLTDVYLEATNSNQYIMDAFKLLLPVLQRAALEVFADRCQGNCQ